MGRAGAGRSGGGRRSSSGRSSSRRSGGHRVSSSSSRRAGSSSFGKNLRSGSSFGRRVTPPFMGPVRMPHGGPIGPRPPHPPRFFRSPRRVYSSGTGSFSGVALVVFFAIIIIALNIIGGLFSDSAQVPFSTAERQKLDTGAGYINECITDELGWFDNISSTERRLQDFFNKTGVQPYIALMDYDPDLTTDSEKEAYANEWYEERIDGENGFLFMYFAEEDVDNDVGYMVYVNGYEASTVMDSEAVDIFWAYIDRYWYSDMNTDDMFVSVFNDTAERIMQKSISVSDILFAAVILTGIVVICIVVLNVVRQKRKAAAEKAAQTEQILKADLGDMKDDLLDKYEKKE